MASKVIQVDPVSRVSGLLSIEVEIDKGKVVNAKSSGMQIRGFENMLQGRYPLDTIRLTARTCGICSCAHSVASAKALEMALGVTPDLNGSLLRDMALGFETLQNNIRQTYQFLMPDYVDITGISPLYKTNSKEINDYRLPKEINDKLASHYIEAIKYARSAHKAEAVIAGKAPHTHGVFVGGITTNYDINAYSVIKPLLLEIKNFVKDYMQEDLLTIANYYPEYLKWGEGKGNYLSYGFFTDLPSEFVVLKAGVKTKGNKETIDTSQIRSSLAHTWLKAPGDTLKPLYEPPTLNYGKPGAYSWVDAPRYKGEAYEVGPLADLMAENQISHKLIGIAFDGTGYGDDGHIWGGEFLICDLRGYERVAHFEYVPMPGGEKSIKEPWRMKNAYLYQYGLFKPETKEEKLLYMQLDKKINCPLTSSVGRLFDSISALLGLCEVCEYEAQAAILLEECCKEKQLDVEQSEEEYAYELIGKNPMQISCALLIKGLLEDVHKQMPKSDIAIKFHKTIAKIIVDLCIKIRVDTGLQEVALGGGVFQNMYLVKLTQKRLEENKFCVYRNYDIPTNDGGISLGQAAIIYQEEKDVSISSRKD